MIYFGDGEKVGCGSYSSTAYTGGRIQSGVEITVRRYGAHDYGFLINDEDHGIAFPNMLNADVFYVWFNDCEGSVTVLQVSSPYT